jgi:hypothetical protein
LTARIQIRQKIHGALLTASTQFIRKQAMNVYMKNQNQTDSAGDAEVHPYKCPVEGLEHLQERKHGWRCRQVSSLCLLPSFF